MLLAQEEKKYWLGFSAFAGIGPLRFKLLLEYFGTARKAWTASKSALLKINLGDKLTEHFISFRDNFELDNYQKQIEEKRIWVITIKDNNYPQLLKQIPAAPFILYIRGNRDIDWDLGKAIAVVGTRKITSYGEVVTRAITRGLVRADIVIVSGMAYGVDAIAHEAAIESGGKTIAVLGCGVDVVHPKTNSTIYWKIIRGAGWVISEFPLGQFATKGLFPARNRIISGMTLGTVVTEGATDSGSLITAAYAAEQGREVFAIPGPITSSLSAAPIKLIKQGAKLVTDAKDILEELNITRVQRNKDAKTQRNENQKLSIEEKKIVELLQKENLHFDDLVRESKIFPAKLAGVLTAMELKDLIHQKGGIYQMNV